MTAPLTGGFLGGECSRDWAPGPAHLRPGDRWAQTGSPPQIPYKANGFLAQHGFQTDLIGPPILKRLFLAHLVS